MTMPVCSSSGIAMAMSAAAIVTLTLLAGSVLAAQRPNIIVIVADDLVNTK